jgi:DNA polymerase elongation subunit (family B)
MGYLIGGADEAPEQELIAEGNKYSDLSNEDLLALKDKTEKEVTKFNNFQMARKIQINSLYGALGNQYFRHYRLDNAEAITLTGQVAIRWIERKVNEFCNKALKTEGKDYVIASDTDSIYINLGGLVSAVVPDGTPAEKTVDVLNKFCEGKIVPFIDASYDELSDYMNCMEKTLVMKRECIAEKGIWTAKKRYMLNVWDNEGVRYKEPSLKMMGIEAVKSSTPAPCRTYIKESIDIIMSGTEEDLIRYIEEKRKEHASLPVEQVAFPRGCNNLMKFADPVTLYRKSTPIHVRGSLLHNHYLREYDLTNKYNIINDGEKIKFCFLKKPNPVGENVMSFMAKLPTEFGLEKYLDYETMFEKGFIDPLRAILDVIGWKTEKVATLEDFFS